MPLAFAAAGGAVTALVAVVPGLRRGVDDPGLAVAVATAASLLAVASTWLAYARLRRSQRLDDLLLTAALGVLALGTLTFAGVAAAAGEPSSASAAWPPVVVWAVAALLLLGAVRTRARRPGGQWLEGRTPAVVGLSLAALAAVALRSATSSEWAPRLAAPPPGDLVPLLRGSQLVLAAVFAAAAYAFLQRGRDQDDALSGWIAAAAATASFAWLNDFLLPVESALPASGDVLRLLSHVALFAALLTGLTRERSSIAAAVAREERCRLARDLHDGLAQELAFLARSVPVLDDLLPENELVPRISEAVERAQAESRRLVATLAGRESGSVEAAVTRVALDVAARWGLRLELKLTPELRLEAERRAALLCVVAEALVNVAKHSGRTEAVVLLEPAGARVRLRVTDAGRGFEPSLALCGDTFGLTAMTERLTAVGGRLLVDSGAGRGTTIEAIL
jgi:signal transduction histidine kinase